MSPENLDFINVQLSWKGSSYNSNRRIELDLSAVILNDGRMLINDSYLVFFRNLESPDSSIRLSPYERKTENDNIVFSRSMDIELSSAGEEIREILLITTIYPSPESRFLPGADSEIKVFNARGPELIARYEPGTDFKGDSSVEMGKFIRNAEGIWNYESIGMGSRGGLEFYAGRYGFMGVDQLQNREPMDLKDIMGSGVEEGISVENDLEITIGDKLELTIEDDLEMTVEPAAGSGSIEPDQEETELGEYDPMLDISEFRLPSLSLLNDREQEDEIIPSEELIAKKNRIVEILGRFEINIEKIKATIGPAITLFEIIPSPGIQLSIIEKLKDDILMALPSPGVRVLIPLPGTNFIGIEMPNQSPGSVSIRKVLSSRRYQESDMELPVAIGKTISNETFVFDLARMPHVLIGGATGEDVSMAINVMITSMLYKKHPAQLKFVIMDPRQVEFSMYSSLENFYLAIHPDFEEAVITGLSQMFNTLESLCTEMNERYELLKTAQARNVNEYNSKFTQRKLNPNHGHRYVPRIVVIIGELSDLVIGSKDEVEDTVTRLIMRAANVGLHLVIATERPTDNIISGALRDIMPVRMAFRVNGWKDSVTILDRPDAEKLAGEGDMLFLDGDKFTRLQCARIALDELDGIIGSIAEQRGYPGAMMLADKKNESYETFMDLGHRDDLFEDAARLVVEFQQGSTSLIQRKFSIGYNRAGRIVDQLEAAGIVGPFEGSKARQVLVKDEYSLDQVLGSMDD